jgi:hypothetical protein
MQPYAVYHDEHIVGHYIGPMPVQLSYVDNMIELLVFSATNFGDKF